MSVFGQTPDTAAIRGRIHDETGAVLADVRVEVTNTDTGFRGNRITDAAGQYMIGQLPLTGRYRIRVTRIGFAAREITVGPLRAGETVAVDATLNPEPSRAEVTVVDRAGAVQTDVPDIGLRLNATAIGKTPLLGGKVTSLPIES